MKFRFILTAALLPVLSMRLSAQQMPDIKTLHNADYDIQLNLDRYGVFPLSYEGNSVCTQDPQGKRYSIRVHRKSDGVRLLVPEGIDPDPLIAAESVRLLILNGIPAEDEIADALSGCINIMTLPLLMQGVLETKKTPPGFTVTKKQEIENACSYEIIFSRSKTVQMRFNGWQLSDTGLWFYWEVAFIRNGKSFTAGSAILKNAEYSR